MMTARLSNTIRWDANWNREDSVILLRAERHAFKIVETGKLAFLHFSPQGRKMKKKVLDEKEHPGFCHRFAMRD